MLIEVGTPEFDRLFKTADPWGQFESFLPSHETLVQAMGDPSLDPFEEVNVDLLHSQGVADLQLGCRKMIQKIMLPGQAGGSFGFLKSSMQALEKVMEFESLPDFMSNDDVYKSLGVALQGQDPSKTVRNVAFAVGMTALSAMGPVGAAAAAIVGFARMIGEAFKSRKARDKAEKEAALRDAYRSFPPLQEPRRDVDTDTVNLKLLPLLQTGDWTAIFSPRFQGAEWKAIPRLGGYALAMGDRTGGKNPLGEEESKFVPSGGVGFWPGQNRITSVIQVSLDPRSPQVLSFVAGGSAPTDYLLEQWMVRDVGDFLVNTTRLAATAWSWVSDLDNSPHLYKVNVPELHGLWADYCHKGLHALQRRKSGSRDESDFYMSALGCAVGSWSCWFEEGRYKHINGRLHGTKMAEKGFGGRAGPNTWHPNRSPRQGCVISPYEGKIGDPACLGNIYDLQTKLVLDQVADRQRWFLRHSLMCAYVRRSWAAFQGPGNQSLRNLLDEMRMLLLDHTDRRYVVIDDVPPGELLPDGRDFRQELRRRGVGQAMGFNLAVSPGAIIPPNEAPPAVAPGGRLPFDIDDFELPRPGEEAPLWQRPALGLALGGVVAGLLLWTRR